MAAISACEKGSFWENAIRFLSAMQSLQLPPGAKGLGAALRACSRGFRWQWTVHLLNDTAVDVLDSAIDAGTHREQRRQTAVAHCFAAQVFEQAGREEECRTFLCKATVAVARDPD